MSNQISNAPRVAVTNYMAHFGGPQRRAWRYRIATQKNQQISLRLAFASDQQKYPSAPFRNKNLRGLVSSFRAALQEWHVLPVAKIGVCSERAGVVYSSSKGDLFWLENDYQRWQTNQDRQWDVPHLGWTCDYLATWLRSGLGASFSECPVSACASGAHSVARGVQMIRWDQADWVLCGAVEAALTPLVMAGYCQIGALSNSKTMRPFDKRRDGFMPSEGIGALMLENEEHARKRGAKIYGYMTGYDMGADATSLTGMNPSGASIARAMERALKRAGNPQIDYINAHGTATPLNDAIESRAIKSVFGNSVPVSSTKPLTGHLLGAAGAVEAVICLQALREQWAPPTLNLEEADEECDLDYIPITSNSCGRDLPLKTVMSLNYGFGGHIGVLIFEKAEE
jgi:3-oxoacyl-(acyl-carrier-protein) synthase